MRLGDAGAAVEGITLDWEDPYDCWRVFFYGGVSGFLEGRLAKEGDLLDPGLRKVVEEGTRLRAADYVGALFARNAFWQKVRAVFERYDLLVTPALAVTPFEVGQNDADPPIGQSQRPLRWSPFTYPFNLTGQPAASVPCGWTGAQLPVGLQVVGRRFDDVAVLRAARALEQIEPWANRRPPVGEAT
jgi:aspartyl-tRNA(Asn)/glutamyl-tRNA(Gln) amidotransferase subunit A